MASQYEGDESEECEVPHGHSITMSQSHSQKHGTEHASSQQVMAGGRLRVPPRPLRSKAQPYVT